MTLQSQSEDTTTPENSGNDTTALQSGLAAALGLDSLNADMYQKLLANTKAEMRAKLIAAEKLVMRSLVRFAGFMTLGISTVLIASFYRGDLFMTFVTAGVSVGSFVWAGKALRDIELGAEMSTALTAGLEAIDKGE